MKKDDEFRTLVWTLEKVKKMMRKICKDNKLKLIFYTSKQGLGGYNYGASAGDCIMLSPFVKKLQKREEKIFSNFKACPNPVECMFAVFFHEFAHCMLTESVPGQVKGYSYNNTSHMQFELWITMLGLDYARDKYGIVFSDETVKRLLEQNMTYANKDFGSNCNKITNSGYTLKHWTIHMKRTD